MTSGPSSSATTSLVPTSAGATTVSGTAVAGASTTVEPAGPPFTQTDPFSEAVRLADGTCVGWTDSRGGSTAGLAVGVPVAILIPDSSQQIGSGTITASRSVDIAGGAGQWNCFFDFTATLTTAATEFDIKVGGLAPWLAQPDPSTPGAYVASVSTNASASLIPECPALPPAPSASSPLPGSSTAVATTTTLGPPVGGWAAIGQYWSTGIRSLCSVGLPVSAIARRCRPTGSGSEYITSVVDSADSTVTYTDGAAIPAGTALTVVVAIGRACT